MKPLPSPFTVALLLMLWVLGSAPAGQGPGVMLRPCCDAAALGVSEGKGVPYRKLLSWMQCPACLQILLSSAWP